MYNTSELPSQPQIPLYSHARNRQKVLIVDDELLIRYSLQNLLEREHFKAITADSGLHALKLFEEEMPDVVILDIRLPDTNGLTLLKTIKEIKPSVVVIMITACPDIQNSVEAMKMGALDYLEKPIDFEKLKSLLHSVKQDSAPRSRGDRRQDFIFKSEEMKEVFRITERLANKSDVTVLVLGESGTGKSFLCKTVHELSARKGKPFVEIGCSNIPEHLIESELFGYEKGAFTDAKLSKKGLVEVAEGGTIFLDEIGDMPYSMQSKMLSLIDEKKFRRIGGLEQLNADVRVIAATNRNLQELVHHGKFRLDLFYRLNVVTVEMPPLRRRAEDIPLLVEHYLKHYSEKYHCVTKYVSPGTMEVLQKYSWPGNVRELKNLMEKLVVLTKGEKIEIDSISSLLLPSCDSGMQVKNTDPCPVPDQSRATAVPGGLSLRAMEEEFILRALKLADGNQRKAARFLSISRDTLRYRLRKLRIDSSKFSQ